MEPRAAVVHNSRKQCSHKIQYERFPLELYNIYSQLILPLEQTCGPVVQRRVVWKERWYRNSEKGKNQHELEQMEQDSYNFVVFEEHSRTSYICKNFRRLAELNGF